jgi:phage gp29-like protein
MPTAAKTKPAARRVTFSARIAAGERPARSADGADALTPPANAANTPTFPVAVRARAGALAPAPLTDRYPIVIGPGLSVSYLSTCLRLATTGYRQQLVDLLRELIENDPHLFSVVTKRLLSVACGRLDITPVDLPEDHPEYEDAREICTMVKERVARIRNLRQTFATLLWAIYYAISCAEIMWRKDAKGWWIDRLEFVHTRRIAYPDSQSWDAHIWDQGQVLGWNDNFHSVRTNMTMFGLRIADCPDKFFFYAPQLSADYPTRDGLGRAVAVWAIFKRIGARGAVDYLERFAKGFVDVSYATQSDGKPRGAETEDIDLADRIAKGLGPGSGSYASHPDSITIEPKSFESGASAKLTWPEWISVCNAEESKGVLGSTLGTEVGHGGGNRALGEVMERSEVGLEQFDATTLAEAFKEQVCAPLVRLNRPGKEHLTPNVAILVDVEPDAKELVDAAIKMTSIGAPVDLDKLATDIGRPLVPNEMKKPRRSFVSDKLNPADVDPNLLSDEAKAQTAAAADAAKALAQAGENTNEAPSGSTDGDERPRANAAPEDDTNAPVDDDAQDD